MRVVSLKAKDENGSYVLLFDTKGGLRAVSTGVYREDMSDGELLEISSCLASDKGYVPVLFVAALEGRLSARYKELMRAREWEQQHVLYPFTSYQQLSCFVALYNNALIRSALPETEEESLCRLTQAYIEWLLGKDHEIVQANPSAWLQPVFYPAEVDDKEGDFDIYNQYDELPLKGFVQAAFYFAIANTAYAHLCSVTQIDDFTKNAAQAVEDSRKIFESVDNIDLQSGTVRPLSSAYLQEQFYQYTQRMAEDVSMADDDIWRTIYEQEKDALTLLEGSKPHGDIFNTLLELQSDLLERMLKDHTCLNEWVEARSKGYPKERDYEEVIKWLAYQKTRGNDYYAMNENNRTKMCKELTKKFGWDVDQNSLQQHERRQLEKRKKQKNNN